VDTRGEETIGALLEAVEPLGLKAGYLQASDSGVDLVLTDATGRRMLMQLKRLSTLTVADVPRVRSDWSGNTDGDTLRLVVADRVTQGAQQMLRDAGVGWLDLRGHLRLSGPGLLIDADVPASRPRPERAEAFGGSAGLEVACWLLQHPFDESGVRQIARVLARSASTVSEVLKALRGQRLITATNRPLLPDLFWELANAWQPRAVALAGLPQFGQGATSRLLELGLDQVEATRGWALADTMAAVAYGAPIGAKAHYPPDFYVPTQTIVRRATELFGLASSWQTRAMVVRVAPVPAVCTQRVNLAAQDWPVVDPLFAALDLARDPARGREVLENWTPPEPWHRVW
jgi:hypothetical protein